MTDEQMISARRLRRALEELTEEAFRNMPGGKGHLIDNARAAIATARAAGIGLAADEEYE
jgi:hypothetical protein